MKSYLLITTLTGNDSVLLSDICQLVTKAGCNLHDCHSKLMGSNQCLYMLVSGTWDALAKAEASLTNFSKKKRIRILTERTTPQKFDQPYIPYFIQITAIDKPGIVAEITDFFSRESIVLGELDSAVQASPYTGANIFTLSLTIYIPQDVLISDLRERFILFADELDLDAIMEPVK